MKKKEKLKNKKYNKLNLTSKEDIDKLTKIYNSKNKKRKKSKIRIKILIPLFLLLITITFFFLYNSIKNPSERITEEIDIKIKSNNFENKPSDLENKEFDFENNTFNIISKKNCKECGFFSYYINYIGCFITSITSQRIPIIDLSSFPNIFNENNPTDINPWEYFFEHPYHLTLNEIKQKAKKKDETECIENNMIPNYKDIYSKIYSLNFYHNYVKKYIPIKNEIMEELNIIMKKLFKKSENILGVLFNENDDINSKSKEYSTNKNLIKDAKNFNKENKYDFIFLTTEDNTIKDKFIKEFGDKLKFLDITNKGKGFTQNKKYEGLELQKIYLFNIIILSKCIDIISIPTYQTAAVFILSEGFRKSLIYNLS